tara:strand:+ start:1795 stop:1968 length:174 start_codon:yes stop_codon:yes gene_type:complete
MADENGVHINLNFFDKYCELTNSNALKIEIRTTIFEGILQNSEKNHKISGFFRFLNP